MTPASIGWAQFATLPTLTGEVEVVDVRTGHAVATRSNGQSASGYAYKLNSAAAAGPDALVRALGGGRNRTTTE